VFELHAGRMPREVPNENLSGQLPPAGPSFGTFGGNPSRLVPSWYFGDGALLANQVMTQNGALQRIVPLDPVLTTASVGRPSGPDLGIRIGHTITRRVLVAFSYDTVNARLGLNPAALAAVDATNASFKSFWNSLLPRPCCANATSTSTLTLTNGSGAEKLFSVAAEVRVATIHGFTPYVTIGGGLGLPLGTDPELTLIGHYQFNLVNPGAPNNGLLVDETDQVRVRFQIQPTLVKIFGVGVERDLNRHLAVRADLRSFLGANAVRIRVDTQPISEPVPPFALTTRGVNPSLQISTNPQFQSSLSLQGVDHFDSFTGAGPLPMFSAGVVLRF
jgi:hypothetical protein